MIPLSWIRIYSHYTRTADNSSVFHELALKAVRRGNGREVLSKDVALICQQEICDTVIPCEQEYRLSAINTEIASGASRRVRASLVYER